MSNVLFTRLVTPISPPLPPFPPHPFPRVCSLLLSSLIIQFEWIYSVERTQTTRDVDECKPNDISQFYVRVSAFQQKGFYSDRYILVRWSVGPQRLSFESHNFL